VLARHALFGEERVHHQQRVPQDEAIGQAHLVSVELDLLVGGQGCFTEKLQLQRLRAPRGIQDGSRGDALVDVQRDDIQLKRRMLGFACPLELWIQVRVVLILLGLPFADFKGED
jgi:hypothetical protein